MSRAISTSQYTVNDAPYQTSAYQRSRTRSVSSATSSSASSSYGWRPMPSVALLTPSPQPFVGFGDHTELACGAFVPSSTRNPGVEASNTLLRFVRAPVLPNSGFPSSKAGTRPGSQHTAPAYAKKRQERQHAGSSKSVTFNLPPTTQKSDADKRTRSQSTLSLRKIPVIVRSSGLPSPQSPTSSASSSASSSRDPSPRRGAPGDDSSDDDLSPTHLLHHPNTSGLHPVLARVERSSKFCANNLVCATCSKPGRDYPACGKCGKMWCSRECRLQGGKRHVC